MIKSWATKLLYISVRPANQCNQMKELVSQLLKKDSKMDSQHKPLRIPGIETQQVVLISYFEDNIEKAFEFYSKQAAKLASQNLKLRNKLRVALQEKKELADQVAKFQEKELEHLEEMTKRVRRRTNQITRNFYCPVSECTKIYGTQGALSNHLKSKHPELNFGAKTHLTYEGMHSQPNEQKHSMNVSRKDSSQQ